MGRLMLIFIPFLGLLLARAFMFVVSVLITLARWVCLAPLGRWRPHQFWTTACASETEQALRKRVNVNAKYLGGWTPLHIAAAYNPDPGVTVVLLDNGAAVHARHGGGRMPIHLAARYNSEPKVITALLEGGADIEATTSFLSMTPLYIAATYNRGTEIVENLLDEGASADARTDTGMTPLLGASAEQRSQDPEQVCSMLLNRGADIEAQDQYGFRPLHYAVQFKSPLVVDLLIDRGADIEAMSNIGIRPLHLAAARGAYSVVRTLLNHGADKNAPANNGLTAFQIAQNHSRAPDIVAQLSV